MDLSCEISSKVCRIIGILCYLNHPTYLENININCAEDIFDAIEEIIEDETVKLYELESCYQVIKDVNDKVLFLDKINKSKTKLLNMINQLIFLKK